jgi:CHASE3 domain sensor protein
MEIIVGIVIGLFAVVGILVLAKVNRKERASNKGQEANETSIPVSGCCGAHEVCDFEQIKMDESIIEYYDDEELDAFKNKNASEYTNSQIDQFREVLYTLKTKEIKYWLLSIERRKIALPPILVSEARTLMAEG